MPLLKPSRRRCSYGYKMKSFFLFYLSAVSLPSELKSDTHFDFLVGFACNLGRLISHHINTMKFQCATDNGVSEYVNLQCYGTLWHVMIHMKGIMQKHNNCALPVITIMALWQLLNLGKSQSFNLHVQRRVPQLEYYMCNKYMLMHEIIQLVVVERSAICELPYINNVHS